MREPSRLRGRAHFDISVVVPCLNEAENIHAVHKEIVQHLGEHALEILYVDDGSTDSTLPLIRELATSDPRVSYLSFSRNFGLESAFSAGFIYARQAWVLQLDADLQFPPEEGLRLIERAVEGYDAVFGIRVDRQDGLLRRAASGLHDLTARRILGIELPAGASSFRLVRSDLARRVVDVQLGSPYFLATLPRLTRHWTTEPVAHRARRAGEPKVTVTGLARHALELFIGHSRRPMVLAMLALLVGAGLALVAAVAASLGMADLALPLVSVAVALGLGALAVVSQHLVHVGRGQPTVPRFLIRESNLPIEPRHDLTSPARAALREQA
ncbi:MAG: glycosyltransferase family 2 protein [Nocardioides sp.]|nr:glycosyltransferase family 2 protein [Nocardioides sp.]